MNLKIKKQKSENYSSKNLFTGIRTLSFFDVPHTFCDKMIEKSWFKCTEILDVTTNDGFEFMKDLSRFSNLKTLMLCFVHLFFGFVFIFMS